MPSNGVTISVTAETNAGGRKHMEDYIAVNLSPNDSLREIPGMKEQAYVGVFDGHGGKEAAKFAREELWEFIQSREKFLSQDVPTVKEAIREAYLELHQKMLAHRPSWQPNKTGDLSTAGTTASTVIFRKNHIFVANVGDSTAIMGITNPRAGQPSEPPLVAQVITRDHKPDDPVEQKSIRGLGGDVALSPKGVMRVVWERARSKANGSTEVDRIPFLSVARSLGDFWSFNPRTEKYTVSPEPDVAAIPLNLAVQKFVVIASDGLWNVMTPNDVVSFINNYQSRDELHQPKDVVSALIREALHRWNSKGLQADNIAILIAFLSEEEEEPGSYCNGNISAVQRASSPHKTVAGPTPSSSIVDDCIRSRADLADCPVSHSPTPPITEQTPPIDDTATLVRTSSSLIESNNLLTNGERLVETKLKMKRRKHRKHRRHGLERELARRGILSQRIHVSTATKHSVVLKPESDLQAVSSSDQEFSMFGAANGIKRPHPEELDNSLDDEGVLLPANQKRTREDDEVLSLTSLRSHRLSTDVNSDSSSTTSSSSSSGVSSDNNNANNIMEESLPDSDLILELQSDDQTSLNDMSRNVGSLV